MKVSLGRLFRKIAGIDEKTIADCPKYDQIWATHIGAALSLTFLIIFAISYFSFDYINAASINFDTEENVFELVTNRKSTGTIIIGLAIATVIALILFLFDRALYQSDWFYELPFKGNIKPLQRFVYITTKSIRVGIRLVISVAVAYALSTFLELRIFESYILSDMQRTHLVENADLYQKIEDEADKLDADIQAQRETFVALQNSLTQLNESENTTNNERILQIDYRIDQISENLRTNQAILDDEETSKLSSIREREERVLSQIISQRSVVTDLNTKAQAEVFGNPEDLPNISGIPGCGIRCEYYTELKSDAEGILEEYNKNLVQIRSNIADVMRDFTDRRTDIVDRNTREITDLRSERQAIIDDGRNQAEARNKAREAAIRATGIRVSEAKESLDKTINGKADKINLLKAQISKSPDFIQFRDGPLDRLTALFDLKTGGKYGATITIFSMWLKFFIIFLEVIPVIAKMLFAPPSVYAMKLQRQAELGVGVSKTDYKEAIDRTTLEEELQEKEHRIVRKERIHREFHPKVDAA